MQYQNQLKQIASGNRLLEFLGAEALGCPKRAKASESKIGYLYLKGALCVNCNTVTRKGRGIFKRKGSNL